MVPNLVKFLKQALNCACWPAMLINRIPGLEWSFLCVESGNKEQKDFQSLRMFILTTSHIGGGVSGRPGKCWRLVSTYLARKLSDTPAPTSQRAQEVQHIQAIFLNCLVAGSSSCGCWALPRVAWPPWRIKKVGGRYSFPSHVSKPLNVKGKLGLLCSL